MIDWHGDYRWYSPPVSKKKRGIASVMEKQREDIYSAMKRAFTEEYPDAPFQPEHFVLQLEGNFSSEPQNLPKQAYWRNLVPTVVSVETAAAGYFIFKNPETDVEMIYKSSVDADGGIALTNLYNDARFSYDQKGCLRSVSTVSSGGHVERIFNYCDGRISGLRVIKLWSENSVTDYDSSLREVRKFQEMRHKSLGELALTAVVSEAGRETYVNKKVFKLPESDMDSISA